MTLTPSFDGDQDNPPSITSVFAIAGTSAFTGIPSCRSVGIRSQCIQPQDQGIEGPHEDHGGHQLLPRPQAGARPREDCKSSCRMVAVSFLSADIKLKALPNYPCKKPSDSVAYRTALTKYLEGVRHSAIGGSHAPTTSRSTKGSPKEAAMSKAGASAAWWKDVLVRKSTIEECAGEKCVYEDERCR